MIKGITVVILAAGISRKMKSYDPRPSIKIYKGETLLDNQIKKIREIYKKPHIVVVTGFQEEKLLKRIKSKDITFVRNDEYQDTNSFKSLSLGLECNPNDNALLIHGDIYFNIETLKYISNIHYTDGSCILYDKKGQMNTNKIGVLSSGSFHLERMGYIHPNKWCHIAFFNGFEYRKLIELGRKKEYNKSHTFEVINQINENEGGRFYAHSPDLMRVIEIESIKDIESEAFKYIDK